MQCEGNNNAQITLINQVYNNEKKMKPNNLFEIPYC